VTRNGNVLVTLFFVKLIQEYTPDGSLIRAISLDGSIEFPFHCVHLSTDQFVVCHGNSPMGQLIVIGNGGNVLQSYSGNPGSGGKQLKGRHRVVVDKNDNVMMIDYCNRIELLSPTLTHLGFVSANELDRPRALHFDDLKNCLYISDLKGRMVVLTC